MPTIKQATSKAPVDGYYRTGVFMSKASYQKMTTLCDQHGLAKGRLLEALITKLPEETIIKAAKDFSEESKQQKTSSKELLSELLTLDQDTLKDLLKKAKQV